MNILYLSHLSGASYAGPTYSVPKQIEAQSKLDNVFWYNATKSENTEWKTYPYYHDISEYPDESIYSLPAPFNHPDIVVVELFYNMTRSKLRKELVQGGIPYVIIPRGELTAQAQARKRLKKKIANFYVCKKFAQKAAAIQYLTKQEQEDSGTSWNTNSFIIPNGINMPKKTKQSFSDDGIRCVSIGRIEPYQKGLDLLIDACHEIHEELRKANVTITICGPDKEGKLYSLKELVKRYDLQKTFTFHEAVYGEEKEKILLDSDVFLITSRFEGHPMALIEALSYGLPCVVTTGSNMRKEIDLYDAGWTEDSTVEGVARAIEKMISEKNFMKNKGVLALKLAEQYSWAELSKMSKNLFSEYYGER